MDLNYALIGARIRHYREARNLSQEELSDMIGTSWRYLNYIEHGECQMRLDVMVAIANALNVSADDILKDSLTGTIVNLRADVYTLFDNCTPTETEILMDMLKHMKTLLSEYGI